MSQMNFFSLAFGDLYHRERREMRAPRKRRLETEQKQPVVGDLVLTERVDRAALEWIDARRHTLMKPGTATLLHKYANEVRASEDGCSRVVAYKRSEHGVGRFYPIGSLGLASLKRRVRGTLARAIYYDIDMSNAHPSILLHLVERCGGAAPCLRRYVEKRDEVLAELPYEPSVAKCIYLATINGGGHVKVLKKANVPSRGISVFADSLKDEMRTVARLIYDSNKHLHGVAKELRGRDAHLAVMSYAMQEVEMRITMSAIEFLRSEQWIVGAVIHDGFLTERRADAKLDAATLQRVSDHVFADTGILTPFEIKTFAELYDMD
jgi:hypothetical protein